MAFRRAAPARVACLLMSSHFFVFFLRSVNFGALLFAAVAVFALAESVLHWRSAGGAADPVGPPQAHPRPSWLVRMVERHPWFRVLLHLAVLARSGRNVRWHLRCIWREIHGRSK